MSIKIEDLLTDQSFINHILNPQQDAVHWKKWKNMDEQNVALYDEAKEIILDFYESLTPEEYELEEKLFKRSIRFVASGKNDIIKLYEQRRPKRFREIYLLAGILIVLMTIVSILNNIFFKAGPATVEENPALKKEAGKGQKVTIEFPDGTIVKLNSESTISYPSQFSDDVREVELIGEAYFDVAHYDNWPFVVHTDKVQINVQGTAFNLCSYPENESIRVALVSGSLEVSTLNNAPIKLKPMEMITIGRKKEDVYITGFNCRKITGWKDNIIFFEKASFEEVQYTLERWYNVRFHYDQMPVFEGGYSGEFSNQSLENVLIGMSSNKFTFELKTGNVFINQTF
jgi:ferric-dicitrate binding protein FerR (iron transport regulator)